MQRPRFNPEVLDQAPPHNLEAEAGVIGSILLDPNTIDTVGPLVTPDDFHDQRNATLYNHLIAMLHEGAGAIDAVLLKSRLKEAGDYAKAGGTAHIVEVAEAVAVAAHAKHYAEIVRDLAGKRTARLAAEQLLVDVHSDQMTAADIIQRAKLHLDRAADASREAIFQLRTAEDLMAEEFDETFHIDRLFIQGEPLTIGGPSKAMKTSLMIAAGISLAMATPFLGDERFPIPQAARVGVFTAESGGRTLRRLLQRIRDRMGIPHGALTALLINETMPQIDDPAHEAGIRQAILDNELEILAFDPLYLGDDEDSQSNLARRGKQLRKLTGLCLEMGATPILCCHTK